MADIVSEYGNALYMLSAEEGLEHELLGQVRLLARLLSESPEFISLLSSPSIKKEERLNIIGRAFGNRLHEYLCSFMKLMVKRGHTEYIIKTLYEYEKLWYEKSGILKAEVTSAVALTEGEKERLHLRLEGYSGKDVEMHFTVDPDIIGGMSVMLDGRLLDGSVRSKLERLKNELYNKTI